MIKNLHTFFGVIIALFVTQIVQAQNIGNITTFGSQGSGANQFNSPTGVYMSSNGLVFVADQNNHRLQIFTQTGNSFVNYASFGSLGTGNEQFNLPTSVCVPGDGKIYIADQNNHRLQVLTMDGVNIGYYTSFGITTISGSANNQFNYPGDVSVSTDGKIYVTDYYNHRIQVLTQSGTAIGYYTTFGSFGSGTNNLNYPTNAQVASDGKIYVADTQNNRIRVLTQTGTNIGVYSSFGTLASGSSNTTLNNPLGVNVASDGKIYVTDQFNFRIQILTQSGTNIGYYASLAGVSGTASNQLNGARAIAVNSEGIVYVADRGNHRISVWGPSKPFITQWNLSLSTGSGANQIIFDVATSGNVKYSWATYPTPTTTGAGVFSGNTLTVSGLPANSMIRLSISPFGFSKIQNAYLADASRLVDIVQWGDVIWETMESAFQSCTNVEMSATDVPNLSKVTNMFGVFASAKKFNGAIGNWNISNVTSLRSMFYEALAFNQPLDSWNTSKVTDMSGMFGSATSFNQPLGNWNTANVTDMSYMFNGAARFNQSIGGWNTVKVTNMKGMFYSAEIFNQPLADWNTGNVTDMEDLFRQTDDFNQPIGNWNTSKVTTMGAMFYAARKFNQPIDNWNTSNVTNMLAMFQNANSFNQPLENWDVSKVTDMRYMFWNAFSLDQSLAAWGGKFHPSVDLTSTLDLTKLSLGNYDATLQGFANGTITGKSLGASGLKYCSGSVARNLLVSTVSGSKNWIINEDIEIKSPAIITQPVSQTICGGNMANFTVSATGSNLTYAWNSTVTTLGFTTTVAGSYLVTVTGLCGNAVSNPATLSVKNCKTEVTITGFTASGLLSNTSNPILVSLTGLGFLSGSAITIGGVVLSNVSVTGNLVTGTILSGSTISNPANPTVFVQNPGLESSLGTSVSVAVISSVNDNEEGNGMSSFSIYPNPSNGGLFGVELKQTNVGNELKILNGYGTEVYSKPIESATFQINAQLSQGVYFVKVGKEVKKLVVE